MDEVLAKMMLGVQRDVSMLKKQQQNKKPKKQKPVKQDADACFAYVYYF